jgi:hypothetical protein
VNDVGLPRIFLKPNGSIGSFILWIWFLGVGIFRRSSEENNRLDPCKFTIFLNILFTAEDLAQREALLQIKNFIFHHQPKEATPKGSMLISSTNGKNERGCPLLEGRC